MVTPVRESKSSVVSAGPGRQFPHARFVLAHCAITELAWIWQPGGLVHPYSERPILMMKNVGAPSMESSKIGRRLPGAGRENTVADRRLVSQARGRDCD
jgi:hypothetical protein